MVKGQIPTQLLTYPSFLSRTSKKTGGESSWAEIDRVTSLITYSHGQNGLNLGTVNLLPVRLDLCSEKQKQILSHHLSFPLSQAQLHSSPTPSSRGGMVCPNSSLWLLTLCSCSSVDYPQAAVLQEICSRTGSPWAAVPSGTINLPQHGLSHRLPRNIFSQMEHHLLPSITLVFLLLFLTLFPFPLPVQNVLPILKWFYFPQGTTSITDGCSSVLWWDHCGTSYIPA